MTEINAGLVLGLAGALSGAIMGALAVAMSRAPGWSELRSFALVAFSAAVYCACGVVHVAPLSERAVLAGEGLMLSASFIYGLAWIRHLAVADGRPLSRWERMAIGIEAGMAVLGLIPDMLVVTPIRPVRIEWFGVSYKMATGTTLALCCVTFVVIATIVAAFRGRRWRDGWRARIPMIGAIAIALTGVSDTLGSLGIIPMPQLIEAVTIVVVGGMGVSYTQRFVADARRLEALSTKLEHEVALRTNELVKAQVIVAQHEKLAGLGRIAAGVAHEINNPTSVIQQNLDRMRTLVSERDALTPELATRFDRARAATHRIAEIVRQLLETGRTPADSTRSMRFALAPVVDRAIVAAAASAPGLEVTVSVVASLCVRGDPSSLEQVLINVLVNAAHAARDAPGGGRVAIVAVRAEETVRIGVTDNGPGIPAEIADRLFEPFTTTKPIGQGTGLGLAVSRGLMARQGGALYVARTTSAGTEMTLELPATDAPDAITIAAPDERPLPISERRARVLVIDDNDDLREVMVLLLDQFFTVDHAATVDQALAIVAAQAPYDVVLCDLMMPKGGAESWLARCGSIDPRLDERTILLTGGPTTDAAAALVEARRGRVLFKPIDITDLRPMIQRVART